MSHQPCLILAPALGILFRLVEGAGDRAIEFKQALLDAIKRGANFYTVYIDTYAAVGAPKFCARLVPSEGLRRVIAAARAGNYDVSVVEQAFGHGAGSLVAEAQDTALLDAEANFASNIRALAREEIAAQTRAGGLLAGEGMMRLIFDFTAEQSRHLASLLSSPPTSPDPSSDETAGAGS